MQCNAIGLKSDVVFTFTPDLESDLIKSRTTTGTTGTRLNIRTTEEAIATRSWTDDDIDILLSPRDLLYFTGDARYKWKHAIRSGVEVTDPPDQRGIYDRLGTIEHLHKRNNERISIIFAFL